MPVPTFKEDCHTFNSETTYAVTNEEPDILNLLLGNRRFGRAAGVLSAGEVLLSVILPRSKEVIAIDHSYGSLAVGYLKAVLLDQFGAKKLKALFFDLSYDKLLPILKEAAASLPPELVTRLKFDNQKLDSGYTSFAYDIPNIRKEWFYLPEKALERSRTRLDKVTVVHGDIQDLAKFGEFSLLYISNAQEHTNRDKKNPTIGSFSNLVKTGGFLMLSTTSTILKGEGWELVKSIKGVRTGWYHNLYRKLEVKTTT